MSATLAPATPLRTKQTDVRRVQPSMDGGRPTDPYVRECEALFSALVALKDDKPSFDRAYTCFEFKLGELISLSRKQMIARLTRDEASRLRYLHGFIGRLSAEMKRRADVLAKSVIPEVQEALTAVDDELAQRRATR